jgi:two-component system, OmpR family, sensor kinase
MLKSKPFPRPWYVPCSLRGKLLLWLVSLHLIAAGAAAWASYVSYGRMVHTFMDDQMQVLANSYAANESTPDLQPLSEQGIFKWGAFIVQIWSADGRLLASSWPKLVVPLQAEPGLRDVRTGASHDDVWRVYTAAPGTRAGQSRVQIVQSGSFLHHEVKHRALFAALPIVLLLPVSLAVLWLVVWLSSYSLHAVARDVAAQDERSLSELSLARVPDEIAPLVAAFNSLLARLRDAFATQRRFVQDAAHELRTPVAAIGLQLENLRAHVPAGDAAERFAQLEAGVTRAQHLIRHGGAGGQRAGGRAAQRVRQPDRQRAAPRARGWRGRRAAARGAGPAGGGCGRQRSRHPGGIHGARFRPFLPRARHLRRRQRAGPCDRPHRGASQRAAHRAQQSQQ